MNFIASQFFACTKSDHVTTYVTTIMESLTHLSKGIVYAKSKVLCVVL